jgi:porphobilinogen synthase
MASELYPITYRRIRADSFSRELAATNILSYKKFIQPLFVEEELVTPRSITGMPDIVVETISSVLLTIEKDIANGINKFLLFAVPAKKTDTNFNFAFIQVLLEKLRVAFGNTIWIAADICLCSYTAHGHCGILNKKRTKLLNAETVQILAQYALVAAKAGANCIAPSDMMDGRIAAIRSKLNQSDLDHVSIMSYAAKFSSCFYGPFRDACKAAPTNTILKNRKTYQLSPFNANDAILSALRDDHEGADYLMVKPASLYTDIIAKLKQQSHKPIVAYHVSGEYAAITYMTENGIVDKATAHIEVWAALQRAGATCIISYAARYAKKWIENIEY